MGRKARRSKGVKEMPKVKNLIMSEEKRETRERQFRCIAAGNMVLYDISKDDIALKIGKTPRMVHEYLKRPGMMQYDTLVRMMDALRFTQDQRLQCIA